MGLAVGFSLVAGSLVPGLLPRPWYIQGVLSGMALALGYGAGRRLIAVWSRVTGRWGSMVGTGMRPATILGLVVFAAVLAWALVIHVRWQVDIRLLMDMEPGTGGYLVLALLAALVTGVLFLAWGAGWSLLYHRYLGWLGRYLRRGLALAVGVCTVLLLMLAFFDLVVSSRLVPAIEEAHASSDRSFDPHIDPPTSSLRSGGPGSLIEWEQMGRQGRVFVATAPSTPDLEGFSGKPAADPIRIYIGLEVADAAQSRAVLALAEMERAGAFQRDVIVLVAPTGSGWIDPYSIDALEYMYNGNTAAVAVQYSYLASWMVMMGNQDLATDAGRALFSVVSDRLAEEPESSRPKLLLYGESLGSFGWERTFDDIDEVTAAADGALWVGPPRVNPLWRRLVAARQPESPAWRPIVEGGETVRFGPDRESLLAPEGPWSQPRIVYLQHASDPITWLGSEVLLERPEWLDPPRGPDVSRHMPYLPVVTYLQMAVDLALGTNAPLGHGHKFGPAQGEAWSLILPPPGWTTADTDALLTHIYP